MPEKLIGILETEFNTVEKTRCVLQEATEYFVRIDGRQDLPRMASHIMQLLFVVDDLLIGMGNELDKGINSYYADRKNGAQSTEVNADELRQQTMDREA